MPPAEANVLDAFADVNRARNYGWYAQYLCTREKREWVLGSHRSNLCDLIVSKVNPPPASNSCRYSLCTGITTYSNLTVVKKELTKNTTYNTVYIFC